MEVSEAGGASNDSQTGPSSQKSESGLEGGESGGYIATWALRWGVGRLTAKKRDLANPKAPISSFFLR